ncbi:sulfatase-like hydrolase/transferase, partial [Acinetobacter baumannii]
CTTSALQNCSRQEIVNAYDNTIAYTDHVLAGIIDVLKAREDRYQTAFLYVSDHGESTGEHGLYLHGAPYLLAPSQQTHVPMVAWLSDG